MEIDIDDSEYDPSGNSGSNGKSISSPIGGKKSLCESPSRLSTMGKDSLNS